MMTIGGTTIGSAVSVSMDMTEGIIARFRTMAIHRGSVLIGHVVGSAVGMGLSSPNAEAASNTAMPLILLPLLSSAFVPVEGMPGWFRPVAEYQPFTPAIETLRGLLLGAGIGHNAWLALAWCLGLAVVGHTWSTSLFNRHSK